MSVRDGWVRLGREIRDRRKAAGIDRQADLAERAGIATNSVSRIENGASSKVETLEAIAEVIGWDISGMVEVLRGADPSTEREPGPSDRTVDLDGAGFYMKPIDPERVTHATVALHLSVDDDRAATEADLELVAYTIRSLGNDLLNRLAARRETASETAELLSALRRR